MDGFDISSMYHRSHSEIETLYMVTFGISLTMLLSGIQETIYSFWNKQHYALGNFLVSMYQDASVAAS